MTDAPIPADAYRVVCPSCHEPVFMAMIGAGTPPPAVVVEQGRLLIFDHEAVCKASTRN